MTTTTLTVAEAAVCLGISMRRVQQLCAGRWAAQDLATKRGARWIIHVTADAKLVQDSNDSQRDLEEVAELRASGTGRKYLLLAEARRTIIQRFDAFEFGGDVLESFPRFIAALIADGVIPCPGIPRITLTTVYRWRRIHRDRGLAGLVPEFGRRGRRMQEIGPKAWTLFEALVLGGNRIGIRQAYTLTAGEIERNHRGEPGWAWPSEAVVERHARKKIGQGIRTMADKGIRAYDAGHIPKARRDCAAIGSNQEWDGDQRKLDVMVRVWTSRGWQPRREVILTAWRDMRSRTLVGHIIAPHADSTTILGALKRGIGRFGRPKILRVDWGRDYRKATGQIHTKRGRLEEFDGPRIGHVLDRLGIEVRPVMPYHPQSKPIESFFRTLKDQCDKVFASFWGGSPAERHEDRHRWVRGHLDELPTIEDVRVIVDRFIEDYNGRPHSAPDLFGYTPLYAMEKFRAGPALMESDAVLDFLFGQFVGPKVVRRDGIRYLNHTYGFGDARVVALQGKKVFLCVQPDDVRTILLCDDRQRPLFHVACGNNVIRTQRDLERHMRMRARLRRSARRQAREARSMFLDLSPEALLADHAAGVRAQHGVPPTPVPAPRLATVRPEIEEALRCAGPASFEGGSKWLRDEDESTIELLDLIDGEPAEPQAMAQPADDQDEVDEIRFEDLTGCG